MNTTCVKGRKFWFVLNTNRKEVPVHKHWALDDALTEARRLSSKHPRDEFVVLGAEAIVFQPSKIYVLHLETSAQMAIRFADPQDYSDEDFPIQESEPEPEAPYDPPDYYTGELGDLEER